MVVAWAWVCVCGSDAITEPTATSSVQRDGGNGLRRSARPQAGSSNQLLVARLGS